MNTTSTITRRDFVGTLFSSGALILGIQWTGGDAVLAPNAAAASEAGAASWQPGMFLGIEPDGTVRIVAHRSEMGTGIRSSLPMVVADELEADWSRVRVEQAIGDEKYGSQNTDGSCSIRDFVVTMRQAGASARWMLEHAAASKWGVPASECRAQFHEVVHSVSGRKLGFGELALLAAKQPVPKKEELRFKPPSEYRYVGKDVPMVDLETICTGKAIFGYDAKVPGMVYASIERSPVFGGEVADYSDTAAKRVRGVLSTAVIPPFKPPHMFQALGGIAVIAENTWAALQGRKQLKVQWKPSDHANFESDAFKKELMLSARQPQKAVRNVGNVEAEFARNPRTLQAEYYTPLLAHAPMEPPAAIADFSNGTVTVWTATQNPQAVQEAVAAAVGIDKKQVVCHVTLLGGGFGRKSKPDYVCEAAILSKQLGKPVKVCWTREDDIQFDYYHAAAAMHLKGALDDSGRPTAWLQRSVFPTIGSTFNSEARHGEEFEMGMGWTDLPFDIPNHRAENGPARNHVRIGWMRAVANVYHAFAIHSFVDELAHAAKRDSVQYLLEVLGKDRHVLPQPEGMKHWNNGKSPDDYPIDIARLRRVIELVAEKSEWSKHRSGNGRGWGIAAHRSFLTYVAAVVEVNVDKSGRLTIPRVDMAIDAGEIINPDRVRAQFEGAVVFGTSIALMGEITAANGKILQSNFHNYPVARFRESPRETRIHIVSSTALPAGVGEPGVPPMAPAICNAIFAATGKRIRELPLKRHKLV